MLLPLALLGLWALARAAGSVLLVLIAASVIALILNPVVRLLERKMPRGLAIALIYVAGFGALAGIGVALSDPISTQVNRFANDVPHIVDHANRARVSLRFSADSSPAPGAALSVGGKDVGHVTRVAFSPALNATLGMGYVRREHSAAGSELQYENGSARVIALPLTP